MRIQGRGVQYARVCAIVRQVSDESYDGNLIVHPDARAINTDTGYGFTGRFRTRDSHGPGSRTSAGGLGQRRHGPHACWHAYRDAMRAILAEYPNATIVTHMARYVGADGFERAYPDTGYQNVGSQFAPAYMPDLCECWE